VYGLINEHPCNGGSGGGVGARAGIEAVAARHNNRQAGGDVQHKQTTMRRQSGATCVTSYFINDAILLDRSSRAGRPALG